MPPLQCGVCVQHRRSSVAARAEAAADCAAAGCAAAGGAAAVCAATAGCAAGAQALGAYPRSQLADGTLPLAIVLVGVGGVAVDDG